MRAAIEKAMSNVSERGANEPCHEMTGENQWQSSMNDFRRKRFVLLPATGVKRGQRFQSVCPPVMSSLKTLSCLKTVLRQFLRCLNWS